MTYRIVIFFIVALASLNVRAQSPGFTQFQNLPVFLNSSLAGLNSGVKVNSVHQQSWVSSGESFQKTAVAFDFKMPKEFGNTGFALFAMHDQLGQSVISETEFGFAYGYHIEWGKKVSSSDASKNPAQAVPVTTDASSRKKKPRRSVKKNISNLNLGFSFRLISSALDWEQLVFSNDLHPIFGVDYGLVSTAMPPSDLNYLSPAADFGMSYSVDGLFSKLDLEESDYFETGLAITNLLPPRQSFYNYGAREPIGIRAHIRTEFAPKSVLNRVVVMSKLEYNPQTRGNLALNALVIKSRINFGLGLHSPVLSGSTKDYVNSNTRYVSFMAGLLGYLDNSEQKKDDFTSRYMISYCFNAALNTSNSTTGGNHEISLIIYLPGSDKSKGRRNRLF